MKARAAFSIFILLVLASSAAAQDLPQGFVYLDQVAPSILTELRYDTPDNFLGRPVDGYRAQRVILTRQAALALQKVQKFLAPFNLGLKMLDAYRPQQAVDHFIRWAKDLGDTTMKWKYYPDVDKKNLFRDGYIASRSGHSRGSTVDLTIVSLEEKTFGQELDMGSGFDFFSPMSWPDSPRPTPSQRAHRALLRSAMAGQGFLPYDKEWWHFTLKQEPFPETYFNFPVQ